MGFTGNRVITDHGSLSGLADDDHEKYQLTKGEGGLASEIPTHTHQSAAECGQLDHGAALTGLSDDDHTQYYMVAGRTGDTLILAKIDTNVEGGEQRFSPADSDKIQHPIYFDRYDGDLRFFRNDSDADVTYIKTSQYGAGGAVEFETPDIVFTDLNCPICGHEFAKGDKMNLIVRKIFQKHCYAIPLCERCYGS